MPKKIILFLSEGKGNQEYQYSCPKGEPVTGVLTFEAPVKYLLREFPDVSEVLSIVTPVARPTFPALEQMIQAQSPNVTVTAIPFGEEDFSAGPLSQIMAAVKQGDEILLETTGGLRDAIMYLLLVSRALSYSGIKTVGAVYSNFGAKQIVDCSHLIDLFDLVGGMQEMASFGSVRTLREYYQGREIEPEINTLLDAMEWLKEDITLCQTNKLEERIETFNKAVEQAENCSDPLFRALLPAFQAKFDKKLNVPSLIKWCISNDMLQQALTIYKERIPAYILGKREDLIKVIPRERMQERGVEILDSALSGKKEYETEDEVVFRLLLNLGSILRSNFYDAVRDTWSVSPAVLTLKYLEELAERSYHFVVRCSIDQLRDIIMDYQYIRMLRNMINHANDQGTESQRELMDYLSKFNYKRLDEVRAKDIKKALERGLANLNSRPRKERKH